MNRKKGIYILNNITIDCNRIIKLGFYRLRIHDRNCYRGLIGNLRLFELPAAASAMPLLERQIIGDFGHTTAGPRSANNRIGRAASQKKKACGGNYRALCQS